MLFMKFISLTLVSYLAYYLLQILLDLLKIQKNASPANLAGDRLEIPLTQRIQEHHVPVRVPVPEDGQESEGLVEKKSP
jgi:hypothetical protein